MASPINAMAVTTDTAPAVPTESEAPAPSLWRRALPWLVAYALLRLSLSLVRLPARTPVLVVLLAWLVVTVAIIWLASASLASLVKNLPRGRELGILCCLGLLFWVPHILTVRLVQGGWGGSPAAAPGARPSWIAPIYPVVASLGDVGIILFGAALGSAVSLLIRDRNILLPAGVFAAFADYFMVRFGTVHHAMQSEAGRQVIQAVSAQVPAVHPQLVPLTMGPADFVFLAFFLACASRFQMEFRATFVGLTVSLALVLFAIPWLGAFPAVAPMALVFVLVNLRHFRLTRAEIQATGLVFCILAVLVATFLLMVR